MKTESKINPITISDEHPASSYGIPIVIYKNTAFGDTDVIDESGETVLTGRQVKIDVACRDHKNNQVVFDWIVNGTEFMCHAEYMAQRKADHKASGM